MPHRLIGYDPSDPDVGIFETADGERMHVRLSENPEFAQIAQQSQRFDDPGAAEQFYGNPPPRERPVVDPGFGLLVQPGRVSMGDGAPPMTPDERRRDAEALARGRAEDAGRVVPPPPERDPVTLRRPQVDVTAGPVTFEPPQSRFLSEEEAAGMPPQPPSPVQGYADPRPLARGPVRGHSAPMSAADQRFAEAEAAIAREGPPADPFGNEVSGPEAPVGVHGQSGSVAADPRAAMEAWRQAHPAGPRAPVADPTAAALPRFRGPPRGAGAGGVPQPQAPTLDALMIPNGLQPMGIDQMAGGTAATRLADRQDRVIDSQQAIAERRAQLEGETAQRQARVQAEAEQERARIAQQRQAALQASTRRYEEATRRANAMHVDPTRWWSDRGFAGQAGAAIAIALGAFGEALGGGQSHAAEMIQEAVHADIEAQRVNLANAREGADAERGVFGMYRQQFDDADAAQNAAEAAMLAQVQADVVRRGSEIGTDEARAQAEALRVELETHRRDALATAMASQQDREIQNLERLARMRRLNAQAMRDEARAHGAGAARPHPVTAPMYESYQRGLESGLDRQTSAQAAGLPFVPPHAPVSGELCSRIDAVDAAMRDVETLIPGADEDIPGVGTVDSNIGALPLLGRLWQGREGRVLRQRARAAARRFVRMESGAAITDQEMEDELEARGLARGATEEEFREGWRAMRADIDARLGRTAQTGSEQAHASDRDRALGLTPVE